MAVLFDADFLTLAMDEHADAPHHPDTGILVDQAHARIELLVTTLTKAKEKILIPAPALGEFLVISGADGPNYLDIIENQSVFQVEPFDQRAAIEAAALMRAAMATGDKKAGATGAWQSVKIDRQIVAIAKVNGVTCIYSNDKDIKTIGEGAGLTVSHVADLPLPASKTPLFDATPTPSSEASSEPELPSQQSQPDGQASGVEPAPGLPPDHPVAPAPPPPGSSPAVPPPAPSTE